MSRRDRLVSKNSSTALTLAVAALVLASASGVAEAAAPLIGGGRPGVIPDRYIVVMKSATSDASKERAKHAARSRGGRVDRE